MTGKSVFHIREPGSSHRIELLDFIRGAGMLLVLIHHSDLPNGYGSWVLAFHMPFMFFLSGYTMYLRPHNKSFSRFLSGRFLRLILPYFLFEGLNLAVWSVSLFLQGGWQDVTEAVTAVLACLNTEGYTGYYGRLWFWPCMFVSDIYFYCIQKFTPAHPQARKIYLLAMIAVMFGLSWVTCRMLSFRLPFAADTAFMATAFMLSGYLLGPALNWLIRKKHPAADSLILVVALSVMIYAVSSDKATMMMFINYCGDYFYSLLAAYSGIIGFAVLAKWLYHLLSRTVLPKAWVLWYGYHSLCIFPVHLSVKIFIYQLFPLSYRQWYILFPAMFLLSVPLVNLITKYAPFMLGNIPRFKKKLS